jgi:hypothetical protein
MIMIIDILLISNLILTKDIGKCSFPACTLQEMRHFTDDSTAVSVAETNEQFQASPHASLH